MLGHDLLIMASLLVAGACAASACDGLVQRQYAKLIICGSFAALLLIGGLLLAVARIANSF